MNPFHSKEKNLSLSSFSSSFVRLQTGLVGYERKIKIKRKDKDQDGGLLA